MDAKDHEVIAGIIEKGLQFAPEPIFPNVKAIIEVDLLVRNLADYMAANCPKTAFGHQNEAGSTCKNCGFDRAAWVAACYGEPAHQDNATPGRT